jgi:cytidylate kinase
MACRVVCVSGTVGASMHEVAQGVAEQLGFALVDEEIIQRAAAEAGVKPEVVADAERRRSFMERALGALGSSSDATGAAFGVWRETLEPVDSQVRDLIRAAIEETAQRGSAVIVSHAASHALASQPDVLRVLVTASPTVRSARVAAEEGLSEKDAARAVDQSDSARADYLKRFYGARSELPTQYDIVVNTDRLSSAEAIALVTLAAGH